LRKTGRKWWWSCGDYDDANILKRRMMYSDEREVLYVGWPEKGGSWVLRYDNTVDSITDIGAIHNAFNMEERCRGIEINGGTYHENPEDNEFVGSLLEGFGSRERRKDPDYEDGGWRRPHNPIRIIEVGSGSRIEV
jgi:hypothetical protein